MKKGMIFSVLGLAIAMIFATPSQANAQVFVGVHIGPVVPRPAYVVVQPRPYVYPYAYDPRPVVVTPAYVAPVYVRSGYYYRGRWCPQPYGYRGYYGPRYFRR
jgi:hypothetical protein